MKKIVWILTGIGLTIAVLAGAGFVYARSSAAAQVGIFQSEDGYGPHGRGDGFSEDQPLHDFMAAAIAEEFDLTIEELEALHDDGILLVDYALDELGLSIDEFHAKMDQAREKAIAAALEEGLITQEQADFMLERGMRGGRGYNGDCPEGQFDPDHRPGMPRGGRGRGN